MKIYDENRMGNICFLNRSMILSLYVNKLGGWISKDQGGMLVQESSPLIVKKGIWMCSTMLHFLNGFMYYLRTFVPKYKVIFQFNIMLLDSSVTSVFMRTLYISSFDAMGNDHNVIFFCYKWE